MRNKPSSPLGVIVLLLLLLAALPAFAQDSLKSIPKTLTLEVGETYTFQNDSERPLNYFASDESIIKIDPVENQITALTPGNASLFIESLDGFSFSVCKVTVNGTQAKDAADKRFGESFIDLSEEDLAKIHSEPLLNYLSYIRSAEFTTQSYESAAERIFYLVADVEPGTEKAESQRALSLGMIVSEPLEEVHSVTLMGTFEQIMSFASGNPDMLVIFGGHSYFLDDPVSDENGETAEKSVKLEGNTENLTKVSVAHNKGYKGKGITVVIIDTGIRKEHEQFNGRVVAESCRSNGGVNSNDHKSACVKGSSAPTKAYDKTAYNHGSHVAGIAAGKDGIAPEANIISINVFSDYYYNNIYQDSEWQDSDLVSAANDVLIWSKTYNIAAFNMSLGILDKKFKSTCDNYSSDLTKKFELLVNAGIIPVIASGNDGFNNGVSFPSCISKAFRVGRLCDEKNPHIFPDSNHSSMIDMLAPGTQIRSAFYVWEDDKNATCDDGPYGSKNCYGVYGGTSMAAPMVTGAFAILKQAYPDYSANDLENMIKNISSKSANHRRAGYINGQLVYPEENFSYSKPVLDFTNFNPTPTFSLSDSNIRGKNKEIQITIPWRNTGRTGFKYAIYDESNGQRVYPTYKIRDDSSGNNKIVTFTGSSMVNGKVYRIEMQVNQYGTWRTCTKYGMPIANVYGATVVAGNRTMVINNYHRAPADGTRYMIFDASTEQELYYKVGTKTNTTWTNSSLTNGKLYYVVAVPYRDYKGQRLWGPNQNRIYFIPMVKPTNGQVSFSGSNATVSIASDSGVNGIRVLYRTVGGALRNGCESTGSKCTIKGLNSGTAYEFYAMKYKIAQNKKYYSMGLVIPYKASSSGLTAPQMNPVVTMTNSGRTTFSIKKSSNAAGISVLYREGEGNFRQACEASGNSCSITLSTTKNYTFYIMQYRMLNGKKVYSDGIIARDFSSMKNGEFERLYTGFTLADENFDMTSIYDALDDFYTEEDLLREEAFAAMGEEMVSKDAEEFYDEDDFDDADYSWVDELDTLSEDDLNGDYEYSYDEEPVEEMYAEPREDSEDGISMYQFGDSGSTYVPSFGNK